MRGSKFLAGLLALAVLAPWARATSEGASEAQPTAAQSTEVQEGRRHRKRTGARKGKRKGRKARLARIKRLGIVAEWQALRDARRKVKALRTSGDEAALKAAEAEMEKARVAFRAARKAAQDRRRAERKKLAEAAPKGDG